LQFVDVNSLNNDNRQLGIKHINKIKYEKNNKIYKKQNLRKPNEQITQSADV